MNTQQFMTQLQTEAQENFNFLRSEGATGDNLAWRASNAALDGFAAQVSQEDFVQMMHEIGTAGNNNALVERVASLLK